MMFESEYDRASIIRGLGGITVDGPSGTFTGILEREYVPVGELAPVDSAAPRLTAQSTEIARAGITAGVSLRVGGDVYVARSLQPDGTGITVVVLDGP